MLGLILIYFIGKEFFKLANAYNKSKWGYAILGVISYYAGTVIFVLAAVFGSEWFGDGTFLDTTSEMGLSLMAVPFGGLTCAGLYFLLRHLWKKNEQPEENLIDEIGKS
ncbi:MAG: hypothetical protein K0U54_06845 [Bacteroidetes bacterium]|nr:hypothetical protein [Bacteroidota bacterium]